MFQQASVVLQGQWSVTQRSKTTEIGVFLITAELTPRLSDFSTPRQIQLINVFPTTTTNAQRNTNDYQCSTLILNAL
jgi:hypothetical protein